MQEIYRALRLGCSRENRTPVGLEHVQPVAQIGGMILTHLRGDAKIRAEKRCSHFGNKFLNAIRMIAKPFAEFAGETGRMGSCMRFFMTQR
jgi:hypothetical protein